MTGAGRGIGRAAALRFARAGARVVLCARTRRQLDATTATILAAGGQAVARVTDIASLEDVRTLMELISRRYGRLDVLINNAGILGPMVPLLAYPARDWNRVLRVNLTGTFHVTRLAAQLMAAQGRGRVISISSSVGRAGRPRWGAYAVSKFGLEGLTQVLAAELKDRGVIVVSFNPGGTATDMRAQAYPEEDRSKLKTPDEAAQAILRLATSLTVEMTGRAFDLTNLP